MRRLKVLITNHRVASRSGTEIVVRDLALGLRARGHSPVVFSPILGPVADDLLARTVPVTDDLANVGGRPDVIHGHHTLETSLAVLRFPGTPAVFVCHDWSAWHDAPPKTPAIRLFLAVDETCRDRLVDREGVPPDRVRVVPNAVDLDRFRPRGPLPDKPRRAAVFSNWVRDGNVLPAIREGCRRAGVELDVVGAGGGGEVADPENRLAAYDVVFAKARCALEAMAVGAAVVACDAGGFGGPVTAADFAAFRRVNFGRRLLARAPVTPDRVADALRRYDPADAAEVSRLCRAGAGLGGWLDVMEGVYAEVLADPPPADPGAGFAAGVLAAALPYGRRWDEQVRRADEAAAALASCDADRAGGWAEVGRLAAERGELHHIIDDLRHEADRAQAGRDELLAAVAHLRADRDRLRAELAGVRAARAARAREWVARRFRAA